VQRFQQELHDRLNQYMSNCGKSFEEIKRKSQNIYNLVEVNHFGNKLNIDFSTTNESNDDDDIIFFNTLINEELILCGKSLYGNLHDKRYGLYSCFLTE
jgi:hypothetical protein